MGWTSYFPTKFKNRTVDRKAECDSYFEEGLNRGQFKVLKSAMVGSTYYAAVQNFVKAVKRSDGNYDYEPIENGKVWCAVFLTSVRFIRRSTQFFYKAMSEDEGPYECKCPVSILKLLSPTDSEYAIKWREDCYKYHASKKDRKSLSNLPVGSVIQFTNCDKVILLKKMSPAYQFKRDWWCYVDKLAYCPKKYIPQDYKVVLEFVEEQYYD